MSDDNVRDFPLSPQALVTAMLRAAESFGPKLPSPAQQELTLWDDLVRMLVAYPTPDGNLMLRAEQAVSAATSIIEARRKLSPPPA